MQTMQTELSHVTYNAAAQAFEAKVVLRDGAQTYSYPCMIDAPITMSFEDAAEGLTRQALRRHGKPQALRSIIKRPKFTRLRQILRLEPRPDPRRGLPVGQFGYHRGRAA